MLQIPGQSHRLKEGSQSSSEKNIEQSASFGDIQSRAATESEKRFKIACIVVQAIDQGIVGPLPFINGVDSEIAEEIITAIGPSDVLILTDILEHFLRDEHLREIELAAIAAAIRSFWQLKIEFVGRSDFETFSQPYPLSSLASTAPELELLRHSLFLASECTDYFFRNYEPDVATRDLACAMARKASRLFADQYIPAALLLDSIKMASKNLIPLLLSENEQDSSNGILPVPRSLLSVSAPFSVGEWRPTIVKIGFGSTFFYQEEKSAFPRKMLTLGSQDPKIEQHKISLFMFGLALATVLIFTTVLLNYYPWSNNETQIGQQTQASVPPIKREPLDNFALMFSAPEYGKVYIRIRQAFPDVYAHIEKQLGEKQKSNQSQEQQFLNALNNLLGMEGYRLSGSSPERVRDIFKQLNFFYARYGIDNSGNCDQVYPKISQSIAVSLNRYRRQISNFGMALVEALLSGAADKNVIKEPNEEEFALLRDKLEKRGLTNDRISTILQRPSSPHSPLCEDLAIFYDEISSLPDALQTRLAIQLKDFLAEEKLPDKP